MGYCGIPRLRQHIFFWTLFVGPGGPSCRYNVCHFHLAHHRLDLYSEHCSSSLSGPDWAFACKSPDFRMRSLPLQPILITSVPSSLCLFLFPSPPLIILLPRRLRLAPHWETNSNHRIVLFLSYNFHRPIRFYPLSDKQPL